MPTASPELTPGRTDLGVVVIGRNEGERLRACLASTAEHCQRAVYVDSGSTDSSVALARSYGADVVELDLSVPFTAARARNAGWRRLAALHRDLRYVQFVDGDCELDAGWLASASHHLDRHPDLAVVCGRRRERHPDASVYNRLCDVEWDIPPGPALACGGDALMRLEALREVGGFDDRLIAGEEPELCFRLRARDWGIKRLSVEMTRHDAAMRSWRQWWRRTRRAGHAYAQGAHLHGASPERYYRAEVRSILAWSLALPIAIVAAAAFHSLGALLLLAYPAQWWRLRRRFRAAGRIPARDCGPYALSCVAGKFAHLAGVMDFHAHRVRGRTRGLIEYK